MNIEKVLSRLQKVKSVGKDRWTCACPSHDDSSPSMHIKISDSGKILINCKAGCDVNDIIQSLGLEWSDLMPEETTHHRKKPEKHVLYASEALELIRYEAQIVLACAYALRNNTLSQIDLERVEKSMQIINHCLELTK